MTAGRRAVFSGRMNPLSHELAQTLIADRLRAAASHPPVPRPRLTRTLRKPRI